jgi:hypothetical protein
MSFLFCALIALSTSSRDPMPILPTPGAEVGACGPHSPAGTDVPPFATLSFPIGLLVRCCAVVVAAPSFPSKSFAKPCNVLHEFPHKPAIGLSFPRRLPAPALPRELTGLLSRSRGIGLPPLLPKGLAARVAGAVLVLKNPLSLLFPPSISLSPEISRRFRGRREEEEAGVELVRTSLACIAGDCEWTTRWERACGQSVIAQAGDGRAALICL